MSLQLISLRVRRVQWKWGKAGKLKQITRIISSNEKVHMFCSWWWWCFSGFLTKHDVQHLIKCKSSAQPREANQVSKSCSESWQGLKMKGQWKRGKEHGGCAAAKIDAFKMARITAVVEKTSRFVCVCVWTTNMPDWNEVTFQDMRQDTHKHTHTRAVICGILIDFPATDLRTSQRRHEVNQMERP